MDTDGLNMANAYKLLCQFYPLSIKHTLVYKSELDAQSITSAVTLDVESQAAHTFG